VWQRVYKGRRARLVEEGLLEAREAAGEEG